MSSNMLAIVYFMYSNRIIENTRSTWLHSRWLHFFFFASPYPPAQVFHPQVLFLFFQSLFPHSSLSLIHPSSSSFSPPLFDPCILFSPFSSFHLWLLIPFLEVSCPAIEEAIKYPVFSLVLLPSCQNATPYPTGAARKAWEHTRYYEVVLAHIYVHMLMWSRRRAERVSEAVFHCVWSVWSLIRADTPPPRQEWRAFVGKGVTQEEAEIVFFPLLRSWDSSSWMACSAFAFDEHMDGVEEQLR